MTNETAQKAPHHYKNMQDNRAEWFGAVPNNWHIYTLGQLASQVKNKNAELQENNLLSHQQYSCKISVSDDICGNYRYFLFY